MANPLPYKALGNTPHSRHEIKMPDASKPLFNDFDSLIEQAVSYQKTSLYTDLSQKMQRALAIDAEYEGFNELLAEVFESRISRKLTETLSIPS